MRYIISALFVFYTFACYSQDTTGRRDRDINLLQVLAVDTSNRHLIPSRVQPAMSAVKLETTQDSIARAQTLISKTISNILREDYGVALVNISEAVAVCPKHERRTLAIANGYLSIVHIKSGNFSEASSILNRCDTLFRSIGDLSLIAFHYNNVGLYYKNYIGDSVAKDNFLKALSINRQLGNMEAMADNLNYLGSSKDNPLQSLNYLKESSDINKKLGREHHLTSNYNNMASQYVALRDFKMAKYFLDTAKILAQKNGCNSLLLENGVILSEYYAAMGNFKNAYEKRVEIEKLREQFKRRDDINGISRVISQRATLKKEMSARLKANELEIKLLNRTIIALALVCILLVVLSLFIWMRISGKRRLSQLSYRKEIAEAELKHAGKEILNMATYLSSRNDILKEIQCSLSKMSKLDGADAHVESKRLNVYLKSLLSRNPEAESLLNRISEVNEDFLTRLSERHPEITKNDKNIALLLRANLSTKQIATIMDCSPKSVNMARYRMRIHLNLESDTNLSKYLMDL